MSPKTDLSPLAVHRYDALDSTNDEAKRLLAAGRIIEPAYVIAREQTAGRGTRGRSWASPRDAGVYLSLIVPRPGAAAHPPTLFTLAAGVACVEALAETAGVTVALEPINDLCVDGGKLGGILCEATIEADAVTGLVMGVGINVREATRPGVDQPVRTLEAVLGPERFGRLDDAALVASIVTRMVSWTRIAAGGDEPRVRRAWERHKLPGTMLPP